MIEIIYLVEGVNFGFARAAYKSREEAIRDTLRDYDNIGNPEITDGQTLLAPAIIRLGNGNVLTVTGIRLY